MKRLLTILLAAMAAVPAPAGAEILCRRDADIEPVLPKFTDADPCLGTVKLQGISYQCTSPDNYSSLMKSFLSDLSSNGAKWCSRYCSQRARGCVGHFKAPTRCGWAVPRNQIEHVGKTAPCSDSCPGQAFIYCSIYHASYLRIDPKAFADFEPNCVCDRNP